MKWKVWFLVVAPLLISACAEPVSEDVAEEGEVSPVVVKEKVTPPGDPAIEAAILDASSDYTREMLEAGGGQKARYLYARADLNDDGRDEVFVYMLGPYFCGTGGCSLLVLTEAEDSYRVINSFATSRIPIVVTIEKSHGWRDLVREVSGGGMPTEYVVHQFDGKEYVEKERLSAERAPHGEAYLADEFTFESGILLEPGS